MTSYRVRYMTILSNRIKWILDHFSLSQSRLAKIAGVKQPSVFGWICGKTQTINFYNINEELYLVDLPGYGYAKVSEQEKIKWGQLIERYLHGSKQLKVVFLLIDIRHKPSGNDKMMYEWIVSQGFNPVIIATKLDKIKRSQKDKQIKIVKEGLGVLPGTVVIPFSSVTKQGRDEIWELVESQFLNV